MEDNTMDKLMADAQMQLNAQKKAKEREEYRKKNNIPEHSGAISSQENLYEDLIQELNEVESSPVPAQQEINISRGPSIPQEDEYYIDPDDTPVFEGGPGISQVDIWKKQYGANKVLHIQILERHFVFRTLNRFEYKQIVAIEGIDALYREEIICKTCVLFPFHYNFEKMAAEDSGYPSSLAKIIMENSGFTDKYGVEIL